MFSKNNGEENSNEDEEEKSNKGQGFNCFAFCRNDIFFSPLEGKHLLSKVATVKLPEIENIELKTDMRLPRNYSASGLSNKLFTLIIIKNLFAFILRSNVLTPGTKSRKNLSLKAILSRLFLTSCHWGMGN